MMKSNYKNQSGYALFIVMGLMVLSTIGVMATYKAVSSYDKKSVTSFKNRDAKEIAEAGTRSVESYLRNSTLDAAGILQQMYVEKMTEGQEVVKVKVPIGALKGTSSWFDIYFTDVNWVKPNLFVDAEIIGTGVKGDNNKVVQKVLFKVGGLSVDSSGYQKATADSVVIESCGPDVALYLGGGGEIGTILHVKGGAYTDQKTWTTTSGAIAVRGGELMVGNSKVNDDFTWGRNSLLQDNAFFAQRVHMQANMVSQGHLEFLDGFNTLGTMIVGSPSLPKDVRISSNQRPTAHKGSGKMVVYGNLYVDMKLDFSMYQIEVYGDAIFKDHVVLGSPTGNTKMKFHGDVVFEKSLDMKATKWVYNNTPQIISYGGKVRIDGNLKCYKPRSGTLDPDCKTFWPGQGPRVSSNSNLDIDTAFSVSKDLGLNSSNKYRKHFDIGVDPTGIDTKLVTWGALVTKAIEMKVSGVPIGTDLNRFSVKVANRMSESAALKSEMAYKDFFVIDAKILGQAHSGPPKYDDGANPLNAKIVFYHGTSNFAGQIDFTSRCFPETTSDARILFWGKNKGSSQLTNVCIKEINGVGMADFYGMFLSEYSSAASYQFQPNMSVHGAVYIKANNGNPWYSGGQDSIAMDMDVMKDLSTIGLVKKDASGAIVKNCLTENNDAVPDASSESSFKLVDRVMQPKVSQLSVKRVGNVQTMKVDKVMEELNIEKADKKVTPYVGFSQNSMTMSNDLDKRYDDLDDLMEKTNFKAFYQYKGGKNAQKCTATWGKEADDFYGLKNTTLEIPYTVKCGIGSRPVTRNFILKIGGDSGTSSNISSVLNASSSSIALSSVASSSIALSSVALSSIAASSSDGSFINLCEGIPNWVKRNYNWTGTKEYAVYQDKLYSHTNWVNNSTPNKNSGWRLEGQCLVASSSANIPSSSSAQIIETFEITYPTENESFVKGDLITFLWNSNSDSSVAIYARNIMSNVVVWDLINSNAANTGSFQYTINQSGKLEFKLYLNNPTNTEDKVTIEVEEPALSSVPASSSSIQAEIEIITPIQNQSFTEGDNITLFWSSNINNNVNIKVRKLPNGSWVNKAVRIANTGNYTHKLDQIGKLEYNVYLDPYEETSALASVTVQVNKKGCSNPQWVRGRTYVNGNVVSHKNKDWRAKWWTNNGEPGKTGRWGVWQDRGPCK